MCFLQTEWVREVSGELCGVTPTLMRVDLLLRGTQRDPTMCPAAGAQALAMVSFDAMASVPLRVSTMLQSAVSRSEIISSPRAYRHFFLYC